MPEARGSKAPAAESGALDGEPGAVGPYFLTVFAEASNSFPSYSGLRPALALIRR